MRTSEGIDKIFPALVKAQGEIMNAVVDAKNPFYDSKYATLAAVIDVTREPYRKNGLAFLQFPTTRLDAERMVDGFPLMMLKMTARCIHESGQWIEDDLELPVQRRAAKRGNDNDNAPARGYPTAQDLGSAITYLRRFQLAAFSRVAQEDDDGNGASERGDSGNSGNRNKASSASQPSDASAGHNGGSGGGNGSARSMAGAEEVKGPVPKGYWDLPKNSAARVDFLRSTFGPGKYTVKKIGEKYMVVRLSGGATEEQPSKEQPELAPGAPSAIPAAYPTPAVDPVRQPFIDRIHAVIGLPWFSDNERAIYETEIKATATAKLHELAEEVEALNKRRKDKQDKEELAELQSSGKPANRTVNVQTGEVLQPAPIEDGQHPLM